MTAHEPDPCLAVWRDPTDQALVACADDATPGHDWCAWHLDRSHGRVLLNYDRGDAARVQMPDLTDVRRQSKGSAS